MRKEYSLIKNNIILEMYNTDDIGKIKKQPEYDSSCQIVEKEDWHFKGLNILRYQNGKLLSNKEAIEQGIIELKENEHLFDNDYIGLIYPEQKIVDNKVIEKSIEEKYIEGLIGDIEYNEYVLNERTKLYKEKIDNSFIELMQLYMLVAENVPTEIRTQFNILMEEKQRIKNEYPKTTNKNFNKLLNEKLNLQNDKQIEKLN